MKKSLCVSWKSWVLCAVLCGVACKKGEKLPSVPSTNEVFQKMSAREKALSAFSIQVRTEEAGLTVEHSLAFRTPDFMRADVTQPQKLALSFDGQNYYRLEEEAKKLNILSLQLPTVERKMALSLLMSAFVPEGFQLPRLVLRDSKQSWVEPGQLLRMENHVSEDGESATLVYVVRWPSLDFLKKEVFVDGQQQMELVMQEEQCMPENHLCFPTKIVAKQHGEVLASKTIQLLSFQEAASNEHFVLQAPEGFAVERHTLSSLQELAPFLQGEN